MAGTVLAIDQGTTSTRALVFDQEQRVIGEGRRELRQHFPRSGWVEHDAEEIWRAALATARTALRKAGVAAADVAAIGITNQRETTVVWDRETGRPVGPAIVWQDRRTAPHCERLAERGFAQLFEERTGLRLDPYFSGTKLSWILDNVPGACEGARSGKLLFGTIDSWLVFRLTAGRVHATDATNASRTLLFDIARNCWDEELCRILDIPMRMLPEVKDCADNFGVTDRAHFGAAIAIRGVAGDQHAATLGQACFAPGMMKSTYGTGCFAVLNTGADRVRSTNRLLTTIAYRLDGRTTYALEGSIFVAGAAVQWLRDGLKFIRKAADSGKLAASADPTQQIYLVPAFVGLGAPWWDADARGALFGLTRNTGPAEMAKAALEAVAFQTADLLDAMRADWHGRGETVLRVDGGMVASDWTMQRLADILGAPVDRPRMPETTVLGAAWLAGSAAGVWPGMEGFAASWSLDRRFDPVMDVDTRAHLRAGWRDSVQRTLSR
ncbi:MAG: glycerol kinase GlpK [Bauldia sp.]|nr:glycerol kinase GlpK [Bauldia sp.]